MAFTIKSEFFGKSGPNKFENQHNGSQIRVDQGSLCAGILSFATTYTQRTTGALIDVKEEKLSLLSKKVTNGLLLMTLHLELKMLSHIDDNFFDPDRADVKAAAIAVAVGALVGTTLELMIKNEGVGLSELMAAHRLRILMTPFFLFPGEKKKQIITLGYRFVRNLFESEHENAIKARDKIKTLTVSYVLNQSDIEGLHEEPENAFCSVAESLYKSDFGLE